MIQGSSRLPKTQFEDDATPIDLARRADTPHPFEPTKTAAPQVVYLDRRRASRVVVPHIDPLVVPGDPLYRFTKRAIDLGAAVAGIVLLSPLIIGIALIAWISSGSPFYKHRRVGLGGRCFDCVKFRTMVPHADQVLHDLLDNHPELKAEWLRDHKLRNDPRVTALGRFLRKTSLDELPQLWNVLRGEMSLVGPRPVVPDELRRYGKRVGVFLSAKPGITGLWQVSGRNDTDYRRRVALDVRYVKARSLRLDIGIIVKTIPAVFARSGAY